MPQRPDALKYLGLNWFAMVMGLCGLSLAWGRATPVLGDLAELGAWVSAVLATLVFLALIVFSWMRWQRYPEALSAEMKHPVRHAFVATIPVSLILLATVGVSLLGTSVWLAGLWWVGSLLQFGVTLWLLVRWVSTDKAQALSWPALTPALFIPVVGNVLAPLAGGSLGAGPWAAAQFGIGLLLWPVLLALIFARLAAQGLWPERMLGLAFICVAPPAVVGSAALQMSAPPTLAWMCWGMALLFLLWALQLGRRMLALPFSIAFWAVGFPVTAFATLTLRLAVHHSGAQAPAMIALALATLLIVALLSATWKTWRSGKLLEPEPVAMIAAAGNGSPSAPQ